MDVLWPKGADARWAVITGGEPLLQLDLPLARLLREAGWLLALETNGTVDPGSDLAVLLSHITISPKIGGEVKLPYATELKVVLPGAVGSEVGWLDEQLVEMQRKVAANFYFVQPLDPSPGPEMENTHLHPRLAHLYTDRSLTCVYAQNTARCLSFVKTNPSWRISLQTHKYLKVD